MELEVNGALYFRWYLVLECEIEVYIYYRVMKSNEVCIFDNSHEPVLI